MWIFCTFKNYVGKLEQIWNVSGGILSVPRLSHAVWGAVTPGQIKPWAGAQAGAEGAGLCIPGEEGGPLTSLFHFILSVHPRFVTVLFRADFTSQNLWRVVRRIQSSRVPNNWSVGLSGVGVLLPWPLQEKCLNSDKPMVLWRGVGVLRAVLGQQELQSAGAWKGRAGSCVLLREGGSTFSKQLVVL